jgi:hypothetical protein
VVIALPPKPVADRDTQPFWDGAARHRLLVPRCTACGKWIWQPRPLCPRCHAPDPVWTQVSGDGHVVSWTVLHPPVLEVWADKVPFVVLLVELAEGTRMLGQLVGANGTLLQAEAADGLGIGSKVALRWRTDESGQNLPAWSLA